MNKPSPILLYPNARLARQMLARVRRSPPGRVAWSWLRQSEFVLDVVNRLGLAPTRERPRRPLNDLCDPQAHEGWPATSDDAFRISVLTPTFNTEPRHLRELFQTLRNQQYSNWEWVVVDDGSTHAPTMHGSVSRLIQPIWESPLPLIRL
jgi:Glycosyl transferase family 2